MLPTRSAVILAAFCGALWTSPAQAQVVDGGFDSQASSVANYCYDSSCPTGSWALMNGAGFVHEGDPAWVAPASVSPSTFVFLQLAQAYLRQTITVPESGTYAIAFWLASRPNLGGGTAGQQTVTASLAGQQLFQMTLASGAPFQKFVSDPISLTAGQPYVLEFAGHDPADNTAFLDNIAVVKAGTTTTTYHYDGMGRLTQVVGGGGVSGSQSTYSYDAAGNRTQVVTSGQ